MSRILILEGVTGAGKSSTLKELTARLDASAVRFIFEDDTLGDLMENVRDPAWQSRPTFAALDRVLEELEADFVRYPARRFVVERFHLTAFALLPRWELFASYDARLARLGALHVLLSYPDAMAEGRSIDRPDRAAEGWAAGMAEWYGSREAAVSAVVLSQDGRWQGLKRSALPFLHFDTRQQDWPRYAETILSFWGIV